MHFIVIPSLFMLAVLGLIGYAVWCALCFRFGHWFAESVCARQQRYSRRHASEASPRLRLEAAPPANSPRRSSDGGGASSGRQSSGIALILAILLACLALFGFHVRSSQVWPPPPAPPAPQAPPGPIATLSAPSAPSNASSTKEATVRFGADQKPIWNVIGRGKTREDAREVAINDACDKVKSYLHDEMHVRWNPSPQYFQKYVNAQMVKQESYNGTCEVENLGTVYEVSLRVEMSQENQKDLLRRDRLF